MAQSERHCRWRYLEATQDVTQPEWGSGNMARCFFRKSNQVLVMDGQRAGGSVKEGGKGASKQQAQFSKKQLRGNLTTFPIWPVTQILHQQGRIMSGTNWPVAQTKSSIFSLPGEAWRHLTSCCLSWAYSVSKQVALIRRVGCAVVFSMLSVSGITIFFIFSHFCTIVGRHRK